MLQHSTILQKDRFFPMIDIIGYLKGIKPLFKTIFILQNFFFYHV